MITKYLTFKTVFLLFTYTTTVLCATFSPTDISKNLDILGSSLPNANNSAELTESATNPELQSLSTKMKNEIKQPTEDQKIKQPTEDKGFESASLVKILRGAADKLAEELNKKLEVQPSKKEDNEESTPEKEAKKQQRLKEEEKESIERELRRVDLHFTIVRSMYINKYKRDKELYDQIQRDKEILKNKQAKCKNLSEEELKSLQFKPLAPEYGSPWPHSEKAQELIDKRLGLLELLEHYTKRINKKYTRGSEGRSRDVLRNKDQDLFLELERSRAKNLAYKDVDINELKEIEKAIEEVEAEIEKINLYFSSDEKEKTAGL